MRLLSCYSTGDCGNKETVTREALSWSTERTKTPTLQEISTPLACVPLLCLQFFLTYEQLKKINVWLTEWDGEEEVWAHSNKLRGPKIRNGWLEVDPWWNHWKGEQCWWKSRYGGGVMRVCLIPVRATCRLKPVASVEDIRAWCFSLIQNAMLSLTARLDVIMAP